MGLATSNSHLEPIVDIGIALAIAVNVENETSNRKCRTSLGTKRKKKKNLTIQKYVKPENGFTISSSSREYVAMFLLIIVENENDLGEQHSLIDAHVHSSEYTKRTECV